MVVDVVILQHTVTVVVEVDPDLLTQGCQFPSMPLVLHSAPHIYIFFIYLFALFVAVCFVCLVFSLLLAFTFSVYFSLHQYLVFLLYFIYFYPVPFHCCWAVTTNLFLLRGINKVVSNRNKDCRFNTDTTAALFDCTLLCMFVAFVFSPHIKGL